MSPSDERPPAEALCSHCGQELDGMAGMSMPDGGWADLCHPDYGSVLDKEIAAGAPPDCYRLVTVHHEQIGVRRRGSHGAL